MFPRFLRFRLFPLETSPPGIGSKSDVENHQQKTNPVWALLGMCNNNNIADVVVPANYKTISTEQGLEYRLGSQLTNFPNQTPNRSFQ